MDVLKIRQDFGLTQKQLAALLGVGKDTIKKWETGATLIPDHRKVQLQLFVENWDE